MNTCSNMHTLARTLPTHARTCMRMLALKTPNFHYFDSFSFISLSNGNSHALFSSFCMSQLLFQIGVALVMYFLGTGPRWHKGLGVRRWFRAHPPFATSESCQWHLGVVAGRGVVRYYPHFPYFWEGDDCDSTWFLPDEWPSMWWVDHWSKRQIGHTIGHWVAGAEAHDRDHPLLRPRDSPQASSLGDA